jgi:WD40 repeat protein
MMTSLDTRQNPYVGPRAFERGEQAKFFGRHREVLALYRVLASERIVLCHSPSGAGKTSLIQAVLIDELERNDFRVLPIIRIGLELPSDITLPETANRYVINTLRCLEQVKTEDQTLPHAELATYSLSDYLEQYLAPQRELLETVLIFDQFEEILMTDPLNIAAKHTFFEQVGTALKNEQLWALFAIREDVMPGLDPFLSPIPGRLATTYRLPLLDKDHAVQAIQEPARRAGVAFTNVAAHQLADDLRRTTIQRPDGTSATQLGPYIEPVQLQVVCYRLWDRLMAGEAPGNVAGSGAAARPSSRASEPSGDPYPITITEDDVATVGDVNAALSEYYTERITAIARASSVSERTIRDWFDHELMTEAGIRSQVVQGETASGGLDNRVVMALVGTHLVRAERQRGATWFELAHDRLIEPIRTNNAIWREAHLSTLQRQAALWNSRQRPDGLLLHSDVLTEAEQWVCLNSAELTEVEREFLAKSQKAHATAERERQNTMRWRRFAIAVSALCIITCILAIVAFLQYDLASRATSDARQARATAEANAQNAEYAQATAQAEAERATSAQATAEAERSRAERNAVEAAHRALLADAQAALGRDDVDQALALALASVNVPEPLPQAGFLLAQVVDASATRRLYRGHTGSVLATDVSQDGRTFLSGSADQTVRLWDMTSGTSERFVGHTDTVLQVTFSSDEQWILSSADDRTMRLWDRASGTEVQRFIGHTAAILSAAFSPDGQTILSASNDNTIRLWNVNDGTELRRFPGLAVATFSPDGETILTSARDGTLRLLSTANGQEIRRFAGHTAPIRAIAFSPDGRTAASSSQDTTIRLWDIETGEQLRRFEGHTATVWTVQFSPDGSMLVSGSADNTIRVWNIASNREIRRLPGHKGSVFSVTFSPDGRSFISGSEDQTVRLWDVENRQELRRLTGHTGAVYSIAYDPNENTILSGSEDQTLRLWNADTGQELRRFSRHQAEVLNVDFSPDGRTAVSSSADETIRLWDVRSGQELGRITGHDGPVQTVVFHPDGSALLSGGEDQILRVWNIASGEERQRFVGHSATILSAVFSPDGQTILSGADDSTVRLWDETNSNELRKFEGHTAGVLDVAFSPTEQTAISGSADGTVRLWDLDSGQELRRFVGHTAGVWSVAFSPDGQTLVSGAADNTVRLWDVQTGQEMRRFVGHTARVWSAMFSPDGQTILSSSSDTTIRLWRLEHLPDLLDWIHENRYVPELNAQQQHDYRLEPADDTSGRRPTGEP